MPKAQSTQNNELRRKAIEALAEKVSRIVSPSAEEARQEKAFAASLIAKLDKELKGEAEINFVGSAARDTGLANDFDIDLFVAFPVKREREYIIKRTIDATKKTIKAQWEMHYAEHPYLKAVVAGFEVEVIPCFSIAPHQPIKSAVDRSPLHMKYLQEKLSAAQRRDVRVLKKLLKTAGIYGAEIEVHGFSGLVCEQLILNYRSLAGLVEAACEWQTPVIVDLEKAYPGESGEAQLIQRFPDSSLILVDAIDHNRNAAAAISATNLSKFITLCRAFWQKPSEQFFFRKETLPSLAQLKSNINKREHSLFLLQMETPKGFVRDITFPQLAKTTSSIARHLQLLDFRVYDSTCFIDDETQSFVLLELENDLLPPLKKMRGPPIRDAEACSRFLKAHKSTEWARGPYVEEGALAAEKPRQTRQAKAALEQILKNPSAYGVASHYVKAMKKARIFEGQALLKSKAVQKTSLPMLAKFVFKRDWWLA